MDRHKKCEEETQEIWIKANDVQDRIKRLEKAALKYPEEMTIFSDIASSYLDLDIDDIDNAVKTYQKIKQYHIKHRFDEEDFEDDDFEIPAKLNRAQFEALSSEYCYLDRRMMFSIDEMTEEEKDRYFELKDLLFADIVIG